MKELYSFSVKKSVSVEKTEEKDGKKIIETVEEMVPVTVVIKSPSRSERNDVQHFHQTVYSRALKDGILTRAMIKKAYLENGGLFSQNQEEERNSLLKEYEALRSKIQFEESLASEAKNKKDKASHEEAANLAFRRFMEVHKLIQNFTAEEEEIYTFSAENLARDKTIEWLICNLTFIKDGDSYDSPFVGKTIEEKNDNYEVLLEGEDKEFYSELFEKASAIVSLWYLGRASTKEDFDSIFETLYGVDEQDSK